ncbi:MAG TPA: HD domain-containing phosphohydrolase [Usitatibacter sp.]|nr:HD domain-containing phosphohydrolase [Usitatibacter sp.]
MEAAHNVEQTLVHCRALYLDGKSSEALPIARGALAKARESGDAMLVHRALNACGILSADTFDVVGAMDFHLESLRMGRRETDPLWAGRAWNNIGIVFALAGTPATALRAFARSIEAFEASPTHFSSRFSPYSNSANAHFAMSQYEEGIRAARRALEVVKPEDIGPEIAGVVLLRRNLVNLLVAAGRAGEAAEHVEELIKLEARASTPRNVIAASIARATYELAMGRSEIALTRLERALDMARGMPAALRDTLTAIVHAEEIAGSPERALARLDELSRHVYRTAIDKARRSVELSQVEAGLSEHAQAQAQARLRARLGPPEAPAGWDALRNLAVSAALKLDSTGWHGIRVGALTKALAVACGEPPLKALEIGLAAELHDVGMLSIPDAILARPAVPPNCEINGYYLHTDAGADILRDDGHPRFLMAREIAKYHHAWWDGSGYPPRVGGQSIPLAARMCAVADTYDELVCGFRAAKGMSMGKALQALKKKAGNQLDPELVHRFTTVVMREAHDRGIDPSLGPSLEAFQQLIDQLQQDRGYI